MDQKAAPGFVSAIFGNAVEKVKIARATLFEDRDDLTIIPISDYDKAIRMWKGAFPDDVKTIRSEENNTVTFVNADNRVLTNLAYFYQFVNVNVDKMHLYARKAIACGCPVAMNNIGSFYRKLADQELDETVKRNHLNEAVKYWQMAVEKKFAVSMRNLGRYYSDQHDSTNAVKYLEMAITAGCKDAYFEYARHFDENGDVANMEKYYRLAGENGNADAWNNLGIHYEQNNLMKQAKDCFMKALEIEKDNANAMTNLGGIYCVTGDMKQGLPLLQKAIELGSDEALANIVKFYYEMDDRENTIKYGEMATKKQLCMSMALLGQLYRKMKNDEKELYYFNEVAKIKPGLGYFFVGLYHHHKGNKEETLRNWALAAKDDNLEEHLTIGFDIDVKYVWPLLGDYFRDRRNWPKMKEYYGKFIDYHNKDVEDVKELTPAQQHNAKIVGECAVSLGYHYQSREFNFDEMKKYYEMAIKLGSTTAMINFGKYYFDKADYVTMMKYYDMALAMEDHQELIYINMSAYYQRIGDIANAKIYSQKYRDAVFKDVDWSKVVGPAKKE
jgi:tetratricopeptide (TPR) repeat protein